MKYCEYISKCTTSMSNPKFVANAYSSFFEHRYYDLIETIAFINNGVDGYTNDERIKYQDKYVSLVDKNGNRILANVLDLHGGSYTYYWMIENDPESALTYSQNYTDKFGIDYEITYKELHSQLASQVDGIFLTWKAYSSITDFEGINTAQDFFNTISLNMKDADVDIMTSIINLYDILRDPNATISEKISGVSSFTGVAQLQEDPNGVIDNTNIDISLYTGQNPMVTWLSSFNINWSSIASIGQAYLNIMKFMIVDVTSYIFKTVGNIFKGIASWFSRTFIDPVDIKLLDNSKKIQYLEIPKKKCTEISLNLFTTLSSLFNGEEGNAIWLNFGNVYARHFLYTERDSSNSDHYYLMSEMYIKPTDPQKMFDFAVNTGIFSINTTDVPGYSILDSTGYDFNQLTYNKVMSIFSDLANADFTMSINTDESEINQGIKLSVLIYNTFIDYFFKLYSAFNDNETDLTIEINSNSSVESDSFGDINPWNMLATFFIGVNSIYNNMDVGFNGLLIDCASWTSPETVTNRTYITTITSVYNVDNSTVISPYSSSFQNNNVQSYIKTNNTPYDASTILSASTYNVWPLLVLTYTKQQVNMPDAQAYVPYIKRNNFDININATVRTDKDNTQGIIKFFKGVIVLAAAVAIGFTAFRLVRKCKVARDALFSNWRSWSELYEKALITNDTEFASECLPYVRKYKLGYSALSKIFGSTYLVATPAATSAITLGSSSTDITPILNIIK